ncbi:MAG: phosphate signaling complex protein PhoU [Anaerolineales bacterium]|jgi:phosphate transport system protein|nr:phosphate signaling complex protein PhoU [Anaerolineales bacterium]
MTRESLDNKIQTMLDQIIEIESMVETSTLEALEALKRQDLEAARRIYRNDAFINEKRFKLENFLIITIATEQPLMAGDLRLVASILEVVAELERMGDYAKGIANICLMIGREPLIKPLIDLPRMAQIAVSMLRRSVDAFIVQDVKQARLIPLEDDLVDQLYEQIYRELVTIMIGDPSTIDQANNLMWAAHNLERMADRVTNICERTIYVVTGERKEIDVSDDEYRAFKNRQMTGQE